MSKARSRWLYDDNSSEDDEDDDNDKSSDNDDTEDERKSDGDPSEYEDEEVKQKNADAPEQEYEKSDLRLPSQRSSLRTPSSSSHQTHIPLNTPLKGAVSRFLTVTSKAKKNLQQLFRKEKKIQNEDEEDSDESANTEDSSDDEGSDTATTERKSKEKKEVEKKARIEKNGATASTTAATSGKSSERMDEKRLRMSPNSMKSHALTGLEKTRRRRDERSEKTKKPTRNPNDSSDDDGTGAEEETEKVKKTKTENGGTNGTKTKTKEKKQEKPKNSQKEEQLVKTMTKRDQGRKKTDNSTKNTHAVSTGSAESIEVKKKPKETEKELNEDIRRSSRSRKGREYYKDHSMDTSDDFDIPKNVASRRSTSTEVKITDETAKKTNRKEKFPLSSASSGPRTRKKAKNSEDDDDEEEKDKETKELKYARLRVSDEVDAALRRRKNTNRLTSEFYSFESDEYKRILKIDTIPRGDDPEIPDLTTSLGCFFCPFCSRFVSDRKNHLKKHVMTRKESGLEQEEYEKLWRDLNHNIDAREKNESEWFRRNRIQKKSHWNELLAGLTNSRKRAVVAELEAIGIVFSPFDADYIDLLKPAPLWHSTIPDNDRISKELVADDSSEALELPGDIGDISTDPEDSYVNGCLGGTAKKEAAIVKRLGLNRMLVRKKHDLLGSMYLFILEKLKSRNMEKKLVKKPNQLASLIVNSMAKILLVVLRKNRTLGKVSITRLQQLDPHDLLNALNHYTALHLRVYKKGSALNFLKGINKFMEFHSMRDATIQLDATWSTALEALQKLNKAHISYANRVASSYHADARAERTVFEYSDICEKSEEIREFVKQLIEKIDGGYTVTTLEFSILTYFLIYLIVVENGQRVEVGKKLLIKDYDKVREGVSVEIHEVKPFLFPFTNSKTKRSNLYVAVHPETKKFLDVYRKVRIDFELQTINDRRLTKREKKKVAKKIKKQRDYFFVSTRFERPNNVMSNIRRFQEHLDLRIAEHSATQIRNAAANTSANLLLYEDPNNLDPRVFPASANMNHSARLHFRVYATNPSHIFQAGWIHLQKAAQKKEPPKELLPEVIRKELKETETDEPFKRTDTAEVSDSDSDEDDDLEDELDVLDSDFDIEDDSGEPSTSVSCWTVSTETRERKKKVEKKEHQRSLKVVEAKLVPKRRRGEPSAPPSTPPFGTTVRQGTEGEPLALSKTGRSENRESRKRRIQKTKKKEMEDFTHEDVSIVDGETTKVKKNKKLKKYVEEDEELWSDESATPNRTKVESNFEEAVSEKKKTERWTKKKKRIEIGENEETMDVYQLQIETSESITNRNNARNNSMENVESEIVMPMVVEEDDSSILPIHSLERKATSSVFKKIQNNAISSNVTEAMEKEIGDGCDEDEDVWMNSPSDAEADPIPTIDTETLSTKNKEKSVEKVDKKIQMVSNRTIEKAKTVPNRRRREPRVHPSTSPVDSPVSQGTDGAHRTASTTSTNDDVSQKMDERMVKEYKLRKQKEEVTRKRKKTKKQGKSEENFDSSDEDVVPKKKEKKQVTIPTVSSSSTELSMVQWKEMISLDPDSSDEEEENPMKDKTKTKQSGQRVPRSQSKAQEMEKEDSENEDTTKSSRELGSSNRCRSIAKTAKRNSESDSSSSSEDGLLLKKREEEKHVQRVSRSTGRNVTKKRSTMERMQPREYDSSDEEEETAEKNDKKSQRCISISTTPTENNDSDLSSSDEDGLVTRKQERRAEPTSTSTEQSSVKNKSTTEKKQPQASGKDGSPTESKTTSLVLNKRIDELKTIVMKQHNFEEQIKYIAKELEKNDKKVIDLGAHALLSPELEELASLVSNNVEVAIAQFCNGYWPLVRQKEEGVFASSAIPEGSIVAAIYGTYATIEEWLSMRKDIPVAQRNLSFLIKDKYLIGVSPDKKSLDPKSTVSVGSAISTGGEANVLVRPLRIPPGAESQEPQPEILFLVSNRAIDKGEQLFRGRRKNPRHT